MNEKYRPPSEIGQDQKTRAETLQTEPDRFEKEAFALSALSRNHPEAAIESLKNLFLSAQNNPELMATVINVALHVMSDPKLPNDLRENIIFAASNLIPETHKLLSEKLRAVLKNTSGKESGRAIVWLDFINRLGAWAWDHPDYCPLTPESLDLVLRASKRSENYFISARASSILQERHLYDYFSDETLRQWLQERAMELKPQIDPDDSEWFTNGEFIDFTDLRITHEDLINALDDEDYQTSFGLPVIRRMEEERFRMEKEKKGRP